MQQHLALAVVFWAASAWADVTNRVPMIPTPAPVPRPAELTIIQPQPASPLAPIDPRLSPAPAATRPSEPLKPMAPPSARDIAGRALHRDPYFATPNLPVPAPPSLVATNESFDPLDDPTGRPVTNRPPRRSSSSPAP